MSKDDRDVSQLRAELWEFIHDAQSEIHANIGVGIWRGHYDPTVQKMQQTVTALIARVRADERMSDWNLTGAAYEKGRSEGYAAALQDAVKAIVNCDDYHSEANMLLVDAYREGLQAAREAIEALGGER